MTMRCLTNSCVYLHIYWLLPCPVYQFSLHNWEPEYYKWHFKKQICLEVMYMKWIIFCFLDAKWRLLLYKSNLWMCWVMYRRSAKFGSFPTITEGCPYHHWLPMRYAPLKDASRQRRYVNIKHIQNHPSWPVSNKDLTDDMFQKE